MDDETLKAVAAQLRKPTGERAVGVGEKMNEGNLLINLTTIEALHVMPNDNILEIGMGNGFFVSNIFKMESTVNYTGCDFSNIMVEEACKINEQYIKKEKAKFIFASADELPFKEETFDKVFSVNTLYFWENESLIFSEIHRVLKPKGQITISIRPKSLMQFYPFVKYGFNMYTSDDLCQLISNNHFKLTKLIEKEEPDQMINGAKIKVATLIINATKK